MEEEGIHSSCSSFVENSKEKVNPLFSVIVIFKEENDEVRDCLDAIDNAASFMNPLDDYEVLTSTRNNKSLARNECCLKAKGSILVFIDSDAKATDYWLHELLKPFEDESVGVVGGCHIVKPDASKREELADKILAFPLATWKSASRYKVSGRIRETDESELTSCNLAIRKKAFMDAGGFPKDMIPCEENVLMNRIQGKGWKMVYNPLAIVYHARDELFIPHMRKIFYYATGRGKMIRRGEGGITFVPKPSSEILYLGLGFMLHYVSYLSGLIYGIIRGG